MTERSETWSLEHGQTVGKDRCLPHDNLVQDQLYSPWRPYLGDWTCGGSISPSKWKQRIPLPRTGECRRPSIHLPRYRIVLSSLLPAPSPIRQWMLSRSSLEGKKKGLWYLKLSRLCHGSGPKDRGLNEFSSSVLYLLLKEDVLLRSDGRHLHNALASQRGRMREDSVPYRRKIEEGHQRDIRCLKHLLWWINDMCTKWTIRVEGVVCGGGAWEMWGEWEVWWRPRVVLGLHSVYLRGNAFALVLL